MLAMAFAAMAALLADGRGPLLALLAPSWLLAALGMACAPLATNRLPDPREPDRPVQHPAEIARHSWPPHHHPPSTSQRAVGWTMLVAAGLALLALLVAFPATLQWLSRQAGVEIQLPSMGERLWTRLPWHPGLWGALLLIAATLLNARVPALGHGRRLLARLLRQEGAGEEPRGRLQALVVRLASAASVILERKPISSLQGAPEITLKIAGALHWFEESVLNRGLTRAVRGVADLAAATGRMEDSIQSGVDRIAQGLMGFARSMQRVHTGKLRQNLIWVAMALLMGVVAALTLLEGGAS
jgi:hypothetical protein